MVNQIYRAGVLVQEWDDTARTVVDYTTEPPSVRPYTDDENAAADMHLRSAVEARVESGLTHALLDDEKVTEAVEAIRVLLGDSTTAGSFRSLRGSVDNTYNATVVRSLLDLLIGQAQALRAVTRQVARLQRLALRDFSPTSPPVHIAADASVDVTGELVEWFKTLEPGTVADLGASQGRKYRIDRSLTLDSLTGIEISNAHFDASAPSVELDSQGRSVRRHIWARNCTQLRFTRVSVTGGNVIDDWGNRIGPDGQAAYDAKREWEHGIAVETSTDVYIDDFTADAIFGDGVYSRGNTHFQLRNFRVARNGRQGVAVVRGKHIKILDGDIVHSRRSGVDVEPNFTSEVVEDVEIGRLKIRSRLIPITAGGPGIAQDVHVHDIDSWSSTVPMFSLVPNSGGRRDRWTVERWTHHDTLGSPAAAISAFRADELVIRDMTVPCAPARGMSGMNLTEPGRVTLERVRFPGAAVLAEVYSPAENHTLTATDCFPLAL